VRISISSNKHQTNKPNREKRNTEKVEKMISSSFCCHQRPDNKLERLRPFHVPALSNSPSPPPQIEGKNKSGKDEKVKKVTWNLWLAHNDATIQRYYTRMSLYPNRMETVKNGSQVGSSSQLWYILHPESCFFFSWLLFRLDFPREKRKGTASHSRLRSASCCRR
jgi:hypothetical protein